MCHESESGIESCERDMRRKTRTLDKIIIFLKYYTEQFKKILSFLLPQRMNIET